MIRTVTHNTNDATISVSRQFNDEGNPYRYTSVTITPTRPRGRKRTIDPPVTIGVNIETLKLLVNSV